MSDWPNRTAAIQSAGAGSGGDGNAPWPWDVAAGLPPDSADWFSLVKPVVGDRAPQADAVDPVDVLQQLNREAEAALRDPAYVSVHAGAASEPTASIPAQAAPNPLQSLAREANDADDLMDMLDTAGDIDALFSSPEFVDDQQFFAIPAAPDVLRLFAGDIAPTRHRSAMAPLTRREHHLVSMDSAYRPAPSLTPDPLQPNPHHDA